MILPLVSIGKFVSFISRISNKGNGSTWPGHIALTFNKQFLNEIVIGSDIKIILVAGTNGKTTTSKLIATLLTNAGYRVLQNESGANLLNGIASALLLAADWKGNIKADYAICEVDENMLPLVLAQITPHIIIALNLFRDQLDRYGELDSIAKKWKSALEKLPSTTTIILNADDPLMAFLGYGLKAQAYFFGLEEPKEKNSHQQRAADSLYCPLCTTKLIYKYSTYAHLGDWYCPVCHFSRPKLSISQVTYPLAGLYNKYNTLAAALVAKIIGIDDKKITKSLTYVTPAFGRQEIIEIGKKKVQLFLAKNPASFNQTLETISHLGAKQVLFVLNDRIPDGTDVSWIWDIAIEEYKKNFMQILVSGDRVFDMALRINYVMESSIIAKNIKVFEKLHDAISYGLNSIKSGETLYILPTYSAMLDVRKILTGKKIL